MLALGYAFDKKNLLGRALCHRSVGKQSNERLEFLGDAVLNCIIANELYRRYPQYKEGDLSRLRANLVNGDVLAEIANEFQIGKYLQFGSGELKSGGRTRQSILADAIEAIIGAIFLDGGLAKCQKRVIAWYQTRLEKIALINTKDAKTTLQELLQMRHLPLPIYQVVKTEGVAHAQVFYVECSVSGVSGVALGVGPNKRRAEQAAAKKFLELIQDIRHE